MINRLLRRFTVRQRLIGGFVVLVVILALSAPLLVAERSVVLDRVQEIADVESQANRLLLLASARVESSRLNLMRYVADYAPSAYEALDDVDQAAELLAQAQESVAAPEQRESVDAVLAALLDYQDLVGTLEAQRQSEEGDASRLMFQAQRLGNDIGERIEQIVRDSEIRVEAANQELSASSQRRLVTIGVVYGLVMASILVLILLVERSITNPMTELRQGAEAFREGQMETKIPVTGADELSLLAETFNQMTARLREMVAELEGRVADRTSDLERRTGYLEASAEVSQVATSILDSDELIERAVELIQEQFGLYFVGLYLVDAGRAWAELRSGTGTAGQAMLERGHRIRIGEGMIGWSIEHAEARIASVAEADELRLDVSELPETRSEAALPLRSRGQVIGAVSVQGTEPGIFDPAAVATLQVMADQVAVAIDNAHLFAESQSTLEAERRAYGEISQRAWADLLRQRSDWGYSYSQERLGPSSEEWEPEMRDALEGQQTVLRQGKELDRPSVAVPVRVRDQVLGVLNFRKNRGQQWTSREVNLLQTLAEELGQTLESARLYQETQLRVAQERIAGDVTARMRESLEIDTILQTAIREMHQVLGLAESEIRLGDPQ